MNPITAFIDELRSGQKLCLLPITRLELDEPMRLAPGLIAFPAGSLDAELLRVVSSPQQEHDEAWRRHAVELPDGSKVLDLEGEDLAWFQSSGTNISVADFFSPALLAFPIQVDWDRFLDAQSHANHLEIMASAISYAEEILDLVRFDYSNPLVLGTLPGRAGLMPKSHFTAALFYTLDDNESYIVGGELITHQIIAGLGLYLDGGTTVFPLADGEVGHIAKHALQLYTMALEANTETAKFTQFMNLIEYLAFPDGYKSMQDVKKQVARHVAKDQNDYEAIMADFRYLTSNKDPVTGIDPGLRTNIIHVGKRLEQLVPSTAERKDVFRRLVRYTGGTLNVLIQNSHENWDAIVAIREDAGKRLGL